MVSAVISLSLTNPSTAETPEKITPEAETNELFADRPELLQLTVQQKRLLEKVSDYGLERMRQLYLLKEPEIYQAGISLEPDSPGSYLAAFNAQSEKAKNLSMYGYAALQAATKLIHELERFESRQDLFNISSARAFPQISLEDTSLHEDCPVRRDVHCPAHSLRFRNSDGTCNNLVRPWWGSTFQPLKRYLHPLYQDGLESVRLGRDGRSLVSPRVLSTDIHWDQSVDSAAVTHLFMQWGQFIDHDMMSSSQSRGFNGSVPRCCDTAPQFLHPDCLPIQVPSNDRFYGHVGIQCLEFLRSAPAPRRGCALGPREQMNQVTSFLDGSMVYGTSSSETNNLRLFRNGMLRYTRQQMRLPLLPENRRSESCSSGGHFHCFQAGDQRVTEQPGLIGMHTLFLRLHNRLTRQLAHLNQHWSDERLFQETRKIVGAIIQHVTYQEYLPVLLGKDVMTMFGLDLLKDGYFNGYRANLNPSIANSFATAAFRFGHSMVQSFMLRWIPNSSHLQSNGTLHEELFDSRKMHQPGAMDSLLVGMTIQSSQARDQHIVEELTNHLFQTSRFPAGLDLAAINVQRGRDHGLPPYNAWRSACGLRRAKSFDDLRHVMSLETSNTLRGLYGDVEDIDLYTGGLSELPVRGGVLGSTFACIAAQQFADLRNADRFWYETPGEEGFTADQLEQIRRASLARILCDNLDLVDALQPFVFISPDENRNVRLSCRSLRLPVFTMIPWQESFSGKWSSEPVPVSNKTSSCNFDLPSPDFIGPLLESSSSTQDIPKPIPSNLVDS